MVKSCAADGLEGAEDRAELKDAADAAGGDAAAEKDERVGRLGEAARGSGAVFGGMARSRALWALRLERGSKGAEGLWI